MDGVYKCGIGVHGISNSIIIVSTIERVQTRLGLTPLRRVEE